jgi:SAM-dependent methyltransferase
MGTEYNPKHYWEKRLNACFNLRGVGHVGFSESYNAWLYRRNKRCIEFCFRDIDLKDKNVLDVGCGTGFFVEWFIQKGANVWGIDITEVSIRKLKQLYHGHFHVQDITDPKYRPYRAFDVVNLWAVVYHIVEQKAFHQALDNISRSLNPGGLLIFTDWIGLPSDVRIARHVQARCLSGYMQVLPHKGFELLNVIPLYKSLNRTRFRMMDNYLGWLYYIIDNNLKRIAKNNLSVSMWRLNQR